VACLVPTDTLELLAYLSREQLLKRVKRQSVSYSWRYKQCRKRNCASTTNYDPILYLNKRKYAFRMSYPYIMLKVPANISLFFCTYSILLLFIAAFRRLFVWQQCSTLLTVSPAQTGRYTASVALYRLHCPLKNSGQ